jgi:hypothetical protein
MNGLSYGHYVEWITLSLINTGLAQSKGRNGLYWFVLSLFLGPLATLIIVLPPPPMRKGRSTGQDGADATGRQPSTYRS